MNGVSKQLPTLVECDNIPTEKHEIPTTESVKQYDHLRDIAGEIPPLDTKAQVQLLIGRDAPEIMKVREVRNGPKGAPWAHKLAIGWTVCGRLCVNDFYHEFIPCPNKFEVKECYEETENFNDVFQTTDRDNEPSMSIEDQRFVKVMQSEIHKNGNWEMPLPLRNADVSFPNNRDQASSRMNSLLRTFK